MCILGFQKTTLLDYPHKLAATIFFGGCNFRCPFCHNAELVTQNALPELSHDAILAYLKKRTGILEGVCITGGEPTLSKGLPDFIHKIKNLGLLVKLDTNGSNPSMLKELMQTHTIDYVAMDIKNSPEKYEATAGAKVNLSNIQESIDLLLTATIPYEFRTTVVRELHTEEDFIKIGQWLQGASQYYLQNFVNSDRLICPNRFSSYDSESLTYFCNLLKSQIPLVALRGINQPI